MRLKIAVSVVQFRPWAPSFSKTQTQDRRKITEMAGSLRRLQFVIDGVGGRRGFRKMPDGKFLLIFEKCLMANSF
jgi:hypothetical protein